MLSCWYSDVLSLPVPSVYFLFFWGGGGVGGVVGFRMMLALLLDVLLCLFLTGFVNTVVSAYVG